MTARRSYLLSLLGAALLVALAAVLVCWTVPALLHRTLPTGPLLVCAAWAVLLSIYGWWETR